MLGGGGPALTQEEVFMAWPRRAKKLVRTIEALYAGPNSYQTRGAPFSVLSSCLERAVSAPKRVEQLTGRQPPEEPAIRGRRGQSSGRRGRAAIDGAANTQPLRHHFSRLGSLAAARVMEDRADG